MRTALIIILLPFLYGVASSLLFKRFKAFISACGVAVSQSINSFYAEFFNHALLKVKGVYLFGDPNETTSYVIGKNKLIDNLTLLGKGLSWILNKLDANHVEDASNTPQ